MNPTHSRFLSLLLVFLPVLAAAQSIPVNPKFGVVSEEELRMTTYAPDTSAAAVVLYRHQVVSASFSSRHLFSRTTTITQRIKVLKESGRNSADARIFYRTDCTPNEFISGVKVVTYNLVDGKIQADKLPKKMLFDEEVQDGVHILSFSPLNVRVGSVVEMTFTHESPYVADIGTIYLQGEEPINWSEVTVCYAECFSFNKLQIGSYPCTFTRESQSEGMVTEAGVYNYTLYLDKYKAVDVPAMKGAPHCYCPSQYRLSVDYDLRSFSIPGVAYQDFNASWLQVDKEIRDADAVKPFRAKSPLADEVKALASRIEDDASRIAAIRDLVAEKVQWDGESSILPRASKALKEGSGDTADINALVGSALTAAGYEVDPVFVKTRDRGSLKSYFVKMDVFNTVLLQVKDADGRTFYLDAARKNGYVNVLPPVCMVPQARVIPPDGPGYWVDLSRLSRNQITSQVDMEVLADGRIRGKSVRHGYNAFSLDMKSDFEEAGNEEKYIAELEQDGGIEILDFSFEGAGRWSPDASETFSFEKPAHAAGDLIYVKPFVRKFHDESDFRDPDRMLPVDFRYPEWITYTAIITIPEGYTVESLPKSASYVSNVANSNVIMKCAYDGVRTVTLHYRFKLDAKIILPADYPDLRAYWEQLCNLYQSTLVLKKQ